MPRPGRYLLAHQRMMAQPADRSPVPTVHAAGPSGTALCGAAGGAVGPFAGTNCAGCIAAHVAANYPPTA